MSFTIYDNVTKPAGARANGGKYPIGEMLVGQVLHLPLGGDTMQTVQRRAQSIRVNAKKRYPDRTFSTRAIMIDGVPGIGIWRDA